MDKLTEIQAHADSIITATTRIDKVIVKWIDSSELRDTYIQAQKAYERSIPPCVHIIERCKALSTKINCPRSIVEDRSLRQDVLYIDEASERVSQLCETFHASVERMSKDSNVSTREARIRVENESQQGVVFAGEQMLRLARKLVEKADKEARLEEAKGVGLEDIDRSDESLSSSAQQVV